MKFICLWLSFFSLPALAEVQNLNPAPMLVSGTLNPLTIAVNGETILQEKTSLALIYVNERPVLADSQDPHASFFFKIFENEVIIKNSRKEVIFSFKLPRINSFDSKDNVFKAVVSNPNLKLSVDDQPIQLEGDSAVVFQSKDPQNPWFSNQHILTLMDPSKNIDRVYSFTSLFDKPVRSISRVGFEYGSAPYASMVESAVGGFYDYIFENHFLIGARLSIPMSEKSFSSFENYVVQGRVGYQAFRKYDRAASPVWLEVGAGFQRIAFHNLEGQSHPENGDYDNVFFYASIVPFVIKGWQIGFTAQRSEAPVAQILGTADRLTLTYEWN